MAGGVIGIGVIGCGRAAEVLHVPALARVARARVVAVCDVDPSAAARVGDACSLERRYGSPDELLDDPVVDAVVVCVPPAAHAAVALAALAAGKHVLVEKPLALDPLEATAMAQAARGAAGVTAVGFNLRCHRLVAAAHALLGAGAVGEVRAVRSSWTAGHMRDRPLPDWRHARASGGGVFSEVASHHIDLWRYLLGDEVVDVAALAVDGMQEDESAALSARTAQGVILAGTFADGVVDGNDLEIVGTDGRLAFSLYRADSLTLVRREHAHGPGGRWRSVVGRVRSLPTVVAAAGRGGDFLDSYRVQWERFAGAVLDGSPVPATWGDGLAATRLVDAAIRAASSARVVELADDA